MPRLFLTAALSLSTATATLAQYGRWPARARTIWRNIAPAKAMKTVWRERAWRIIRPRCPLPARPFWKPPVAVEVREWVGTPNRALPGSGSTERHPGPSILRPVGLIAVKLVNIVMSSRFVVGGFYRYAPHERCVWPMPSAPVRLSFASEKTLACAP